MPTPAEDALSTIGKADGARPASAADAAHWLANPTIPIKRKTLIDLWTEQVERAEETACPSQK